MLEKKKIAITMGDAGGIGPEVTVKASLSEDIQTLCSPCLIGNRKILEEAAELSGLYLAPDKVDIIESTQVKNFIKGKPSVESGKSSFEFIKYAVEGCLKGDFYGVVTAPISKEALKMAGFSWPGHTEMLAELTSTERYAMMLTGGPLKVVLVTTHVSLREVPYKLSVPLISVPLIIEKIELAYTAGKMFGIRRPSIGVAGLNPHSGEGGIFGREEIDVIKPAVEAAKNKGLPVEGPISPDVIFRLAYTGKVDIVLAMYHDQGLIPLKMIAFDSGVNITLGLPIIRTSPDHGTAYNIAWRGIASPASMIEAIKTAIRLSL